MSTFFDVISERLAAVNRHAPPASRTKQFHCACGHAVFMDNTQCLACGAQLAFFPDRGEVLAIMPAVPLVQPPEDPVALERWTPMGAATSGLYRRCANLEMPAVCNWVMPDSDPYTLCLACRLNRTIPDLSIPENGERWYKLESAKRRLVAQLLTMGLEVTPSIQPSDGGMMFDLLGPGPDGKLPMTGHDEGLITINVLEADDHYRARLREEMGEPYRTLLGHFRHEVGHYYWDRLILPTHWRPVFRQVFGDERTDYAEALKVNYEQGPPADWETRFISTYAACHPWEDWAETWAHYLHMMDTLDTALSYGISTHAVRPDYVPFTTDALYDPHASDAQEFLELINAWVQLTSVLNELSRSMGLRDFYPFILAREVVGKLQFVHRVVKNSS